MSHEGGTNNKFIVVFYSITVVLLFLNIGLLGYCGSGIETNQNKIAAVEQEIKTANERTALLLQEVRQIRKEIRNN